MHSKPPKSKKRGGGMFSTDPNDPNANRTWGEWASSMNPLGTKKTPVQPVEKTPPVQPVSSQVLPAPAQRAVEAGHKIAQRAGRRLQKHLGGYNIASGGSMQKLFGTAKGDYMLGGKRRRGKTRRHH